MNLGATSPDEQKRMMNDNNVIKNILRIPVIELEQLNPRIRGIHGVMGVKYRTMSGNVDDVESSMTYEYDWVGAELVFIDNPYPRVPVGTGKVAWVYDDEKDPMANTLTVPAGAKSGEERGWNKEFLATHYGDCFWKVMDEEIDLEIQERYYNIMCNVYVAEAMKLAEGDKTIDRAKIEERAEKKAYDKLQEAIEKQNKGVSAVSVNIQKVTTPQVTKRTLPAAQKLTDVEQSDTVQNLVDENKKKQAEIDRLVAEMEGEKPAKEAESAEQKKTKKEIFMANMAKGKKRKQEELTGNLLG